MVSLSMVWQNMDQPFQLGPARLVQLGLDVSGSDTREN